MSGVWISGVLSNYQIGHKLGLRWRYPGQEWSEPTHILPPPTDEDVDWQRLYQAGFRLSDHQVPEALAIWEPACFARTGDMFDVGVYVVKPRLAEVLSRFDLGDGGLTPIPIYEADLETRAKGDYWLLHFGARKNSFLPELSNKEGYRIRSGGVAKRSGAGFTAGIEYWKVSSIIQNGDVVVSSAALQGADLWAEERVPTNLFMSDALAQTIAGMKLNKVDFKLKQCRVVEG